jgi:hypothetical protein
MSESHNRRRTLPAGYYDRRALGTAEQWRAVCIGAGAGVVAYYIARLFFGRTLIRRGGAPAAPAAPVVPVVPRSRDGSDTERLLSPSTTGTART